MSALEKKFPFSQLRLVAALGLLSTTSQLLYAAEVAGRVNFVSGSAFVSSTQNQQRSVFKGDLIYAGERIETNSNSRIQVKMTDGGTIILRPNSSFEIAKYSFSKDTPELGSVLFNFIKGGARAVSGAIGKVNRENYKFSSTVATIGIRGTDYSASLDNGKLTVTVNEGKIELANQQGDAEVNEGETYTVSATTKPSLCHRITQDSDANDIHTCNPVLISLDTDESLSVSKQKIKKPTLENYTSYGAFVEAVRRYKSVEQEVERMEGKEAESPIIIVPNPTSLTNTANFSINRQLLLDRLENAELGNISIANVFGFINVVNDEETLGLTKNIYDDEILKSLVFKDKSEEPTKNNTTDYAFNSENFIDFKDFLESLFLLNSDTIFGNNMRVTGLEIGNPKVNVTLGNSLFDAINVQLTAATRNSSYATNLGLDNSLLQNILDLNGNNKYGSLLSVRQVAIYDRDGLNKNDIGAFLQIGDGTAYDSTVVLTDDGSPLNVALDLIDFVNPRDYKYSELNNTSVISVDINTPQLLVKLGSVYVGSFRTETDRNTDRAINLDDVTDANLNKDSIVKIMDPTTIVLGEATINARLEHTPNRKAYNVNGINVNPNLSIFADASIKSGISVYDFALIDSDGPIQGGRIGFDKLNIIDTSGTSLTAKLAVYIESDFTNSKLRLFGTNLDSLVIDIEQLGNAKQGVDLNISNLYFGSKYSNDIGDVQIKGLDINGSRIILRGH